MNGIVQNWFEFDVLFVKFQRLRDIDLLLLVFLQYPTFSVINGGDLFRLMLLSHVFCSAEARVFNCPSISQSDAGCFLTSLEIIISHFTVCIFSTAHLDNVCSMMYQSHMILVLSLFWALVLLFEISYELWKYLPYLLFGDRYCNCFINASLAASALNPKLPQGKNCNGNSWRAILPFSVLSTYTFALRAFKKSPKWRIIHCYYLGQCSFPTIKNIPEHPQTSLLDGVLKRSPVHIYMEGMKNLTRNTMVHRAAKIVLTKPAFTIGLFRTIFHICSVLKLFAWFVQMPFQ